MKTSPSRMVVGALLGAGMVVALFTLTGWRWGLFLSLLLVYEGWTLVNPFPNDTISETVWGFCDRLSLVPFLLGAGAVSLVYVGILRPTTEGLLVSLALGLLLGHFVFPRHLPPQA